MTTGSCHTMCSICYAASRSVVPRHRLFQTNFSAAAFLPASYPTVKLGESTLDKDRRGVIRSPWSRERERESQSARKTHYHSVTHFWLSFLCRSFFSSKCDAFHWLFPFLFTTQEVFWQIGHSKGGQKYGEKGSGSWGFAQLIESPIFYWIFKMVSRFVHLASFFG